jgi:hypothetical protein
MDKVGSPVGNVGSEAGDPLQVVVVPVAWYGPIVMNTSEEIRIAFEEYRRGTFIKHR